MVLGLGVFQRLKKAPGWVGEWAGEVERNDGLTTMGNNNYNRGGKMDWGRG